MTNGWPTDVQDPVWLRENMGCTNTIFTPRQVSEHIIKLLDQQQEKAFHRFDWKKLFSILDFERTGHVLDT